MTNQAPKRIWDNFVEVGEVRKSDGIKFVVAAATRKGYRFINIREFYLRKADNTWRPGRDGITLPLIAPLNKGETFIHPTAEMFKVLKKTVEVLKDLPLMDENNAVWSAPKE